MENASIEPGTPDANPAGSDPGELRRVPTERGFWGLLGLQFAGVLGEYIFKALLFLLVLSLWRDSPRPSAVWLGLFSGAVALQTLPFILFSGWAGGLSDRLSKRSLILSIKGIETLGLLLGGLSLYFLTRGEAVSPWAFFGATAVMFLLSTCLAYYGPNKYGIMPEILSEQRVIWGNGFMELATFAAVVLGLLIGVGLFGSMGPAPWQRSSLMLVSIILVSLGVLGILMGLFIKSVPAANPGFKPARNPFAELWKNIRIIMADRFLLLSVLGISYFWALGVIIIANLPLWGEQALGIGLHDKASGFLVVPVLIGIGCGGVLVGLVSKLRIELGFVPLGGLGIALLSFPLSIADAEPVSGQFVLAPVPLLILMVFCLIFLGFCAGLFIVPLNAMLQQNAPSRERGGVIAAANFFAFCSALLGLGFFFLFRNVMNFSPSNIFAISSLVTLGAMIYLITLLPEALLGLVSTIVTRFVYRIRVQGGEHIPRHGPALLVSNHVSMVDALLISAISPRPVRCIVWREIYDTPLLGYFLKIMKAIPVSSDQRPRALISSLTTAADALNNGELVCIFAEGQVTRPGLMLPFRRGFRQILAKAPAPVIPVYLEGVWGGILRYERKKFTWKLPLKLPYVVRIAVGKPLPHDVSMHEMRETVMELSADCAMTKRDMIKPVHHRFIRYARGHRGDFCVADSMTPPMKFGKALIGSIILARRLRKILGDQEMVGIFLPPSVGAVLTNIAVAISGRTAVNLNYTTGPEILRHCIDDCKIKTVITSRLFLKKLEMEPPPGSLFLDDMKKQKTKISEVLGGLFGAFCLPIRSLESFCGAIKHPDPDSLMTVIFSSGSTGMPKGVMLTHFNIGSNIASIEQAVSLWPDDRMIGFLPFFHSFGYTAALWGSLCIGFGVIHHPNPLEAKVIGDLVEKFKVTVMIATPTFLQNYIRRVEPEKFSSLEFVLTGAEKLPQRVADAFRERFGVQVHEGYGTTECAPVVAANVDEYRSRGFYQFASKPGTVGHPIPGVAVRIVDVDTGDGLPGGEAGMIEVRGPNIMRGYLNMEEKTREVIRPGGWYVTGDVGYLDDDGFIHITDRLARFSKIGGEMVPHVKVEEELHRAAGLTEQSFAVTAVPDQVKGERLVVLHTLEPMQIEGLTEKLADTGLPNLWIPRRTMFFHIDSIPLLGSGKLDLGEIRRTAARFAVAEPVPVEK